MPAFGSTSSAARLPFVAVPFVYPEASPELATDFDDPDGLLGSVSFVEPAREPVDELAKFDEAEICFATASDREVMNVLFDKSSAIGLVS